MNIATTAKNLHQKWQWAVEIAGFNTALFSKATWPGVEVDEVTFAAAGSAYDEKAAGRMKFGDIVLEKGIAADGADEGAIQWLKTAVNAVTGIGLPAPAYMLDFDLVMYDRTGQELKRRHVHGAWVKKVEYDDLEGGQSANTLEKITVAYQYWD